MAHRAISLLGDLFNFLAVVLFEGKKCARFFAKRVCLIGEGRRSLTHVISFFLPFFIPMKCSCRVSSVSFSSLIFPNFNYTWKKLVKIITVRIVDATRVLNFLRKFGATQRASNEILKWKWKSKAECQWQFFVLFSLKLLKIKQRRAYHA